MLNAFEREVLRKIHWQWRNNGYNDELYNLYKEMELSENIRLRRLQWVAYMTRMKDERVLKKALEGYIDGRRSVVRLKR
jgi:hypothetical protein